MAKIPKAKEPPKLLRGLNNVLEFGKHRGKTVQQVMKSDPNWLHWALQNISGFKLNRNALSLLPKMYVPHDREAEEWWNGGFDKHYNN